MPEFVIRRLTERLTAFTAPSSPTKVNTFLGRTQPTIWNHAIFPGLSYIDLLNLMITSYR